MSLRGHLFQESPPGWPACKKDTPGYKCRPPYQLCIFRTSLGFLFCGLWTWQGYCKDQTETKEKYLA